MTVASAVLLIWAWGPIGAPLGSLLGALLVSLPLNIRSVSREMGASPLKWCLALGPLVAAILTATAAATVAATLLGGGGLVGAAAVTAAALLLYGALVLPIVRHGAVAPYVALALAPLRRRLPWGPPVRPSEAR